MPTVMIGSARDVVEHCGVPRFLFTDFPLGNPCGHPWNPQMQRDVVSRALSMLETAAEPRTTAIAPHVWKDDPGWRERYARVTPAERERLLALGQERRKNQAEVLRLKAS